MPYGLAGYDVAALWLSLRDLAGERLAEVERAAGEYLGAPVEAIARSELESRLGDGSIVLIDVRPLEEFDAGHIDGALDLVALVVEHAGNHLRERSLASGLPANPQPHQVTRSPRNPARSRSLAAVVVQ